MLGAMLIIFLVKAQDNIGPFRPEFYLLFILCWPYVIFEIIRTSLEKYEKDEKDERTIMSKMFEQTVDGTPVSLDLIDNVMPTIEPSAWKVLMLINYKSKARHDVIVRLTYDQLRDGTGIKSSATINRALVKLIDDELIVVEHNGIDPFLVDQISCKLGEAIPVLSGDD